MPVGYHISTLSFFQDYVNTAVAVDRLLRSGSSQADVQFFGFLTDEVMNLDIQLPDARVIGLSDGDSSALCKAVLSGIHRMSGTQLACTGLQVVRVNGESSIRPFLCGARSSIIAFTLADDSDGAFAKNQPALFFEADRSTDDKPKSCIEANTLGSYTFKLMNRKLKTVFMERGEERSGCWHASSGDHVPLTVREGSRRLIVPCASADPVFLVVVYESITSWKARNPRKELDLLIESGFTPCMSKRLGVPAASRRQLVPVGSRGCAAQMPTKQLKIGESIGRWASTMRRANSENKLHELH